MNKKALITGITGQDGSYLAEYLLDKGYKVRTTIRSESRKQEVLVRREWNPVKGGVAGWEAMGS